MGGRLDPERWKLLTELFHESLDLPPERRGERLQIVRSTDPDLAEELEALLSSHEALEVPGEPEVRSSLHRLETLDLALATELLEEGEPTRLEPGAAVGPYRLIQELGRGGMGEVYLAEDPRLDRRVALKLLPPWLASDNLARRRFTAEARAASSLDHPHIITIYEIDETSEGRLYIAMAYYEGETLADRIARGPVPLDEALTFGEQLASALAAAHEIDIVHRDVKPSNVVVTGDGNARILDFGVAKMKGSRLTREGAVAGTVAYMSPEQTRGEECDARSDLWSLGVVLFEMLAGEHPFGSGADEALLHSIRHDEPRSLTDARPDVPEPLARLVERLLARDPERRPESASDVAEELQTLGAEGSAPAAPSVAASAMVTRLARTRGLPGLALGTVALALVGFLLLDGRAADRNASAAASGSRPPAALSAPHGRLAVLPLADLGPDADRDHLAAGLTAELTARLGRLPGVTTIAHSSSRRLRDSGLSPAEIGERLGARTLLEGSVRRSGDRVRIALELVDASSGEQTWSDSFEGDLVDVLETQETISRRIASALRIELELEEAALRRTTTDPDAYLTYLEARYHWESRTPDGIRTSRELFERALDLDPVFAEAWVGLADAYLALGSYGMMPPSEAFPRARAAAERALVVEPELAEAHASLAAALADYYWDWEGAERRFRRAIELRPDYAPAHYWLSELLAHRGRPDEAIEAARRAQELDPLTQLAFADEGRALYQARRYDEAIEVLERTLAHGPSFVAYLYKGLAHAGRGDLDEAVGTLEAGREAFPQIPTATALLAYAYGRAGRKAAARTLLDELRSRREAGAPVAAIDLASVELGLDRVDEALNWLERSIEERDWQVVFLETEPVFDPLRSDPRFSALLDRVRPLEPGGTADG